MNRVVKIWSIPLVGLLVSGACRPDFDSLYAGAGGGGLSALGGTHQGGCSANCNSGGSGGASTGGVTEVGGAGAGAGAGAGGAPEGGSTSGGSSATGGTTASGGRAEVAAGAGSGGEGGGGDECLPKVPSGPGAIAAYDFEEESGTVVSDASGAGNTATLAGGRWVSAGRHGRALSFDDANQYVTLPAEVVSSLDAVTISTWLKLSSNAQGSTLFDFGADASNRFYFVTNTGGGLRFATVAAGVETSIALSRPLPDNVWVHVAVVLGGGRALLYVNGIEMARVTNTFAPSSLGNTSENWIGKSHSGSGNLLGTIDDFKIYGRVLAREEVAQLATPDYLYFDFDEPCGTRAHDRSSAALTGELPNGGTWTSGRIGGSLELDGEDQYLRLPTGIVEQCNDLSLAFWAQRTSTAGVSEHIIDFGQNQRTFLYVSPQSRGAGQLRFAIKLNGLENDLTAEQTLTASALPLGTWQHVAVVLQNGVGTLYVNGTQYDSRAISIRPSALGSTLVNTVGRSQYYNAALGPDSFYAGRIDDLRISCRAFPSSEVAFLAIKP
ncbi:MAG: LamG domain-containing protein [Myxococcota bacterium]